MYDKRWDLIARHVGKRTKNKIFNKFKKMKEQIGSQPIVALITRKLDSETT